ncbi:hypothetical protein GOP47_0015136 [Adiantum capillus-veneris]|uniref:Uncharacterized protein n=1 Tax=Adiantum capillus-veneris TaxID=13818 RepID=A0A9D4ZCT4_ADICA|nr:hypothetical protein GOP47_0015136 [Adiantum capillus-veneris]
MSSGWSSGISSRDRFVGPALLVESRAAGHSNCDLALRPSEATKVAAFAALGASRLCASTVWFAWCRASAWCLTKAFVQENGRWPDAAAASGGDDDSCIDGSENRAGWRLYNDCIRGYDVEHAEIRQSKYATGGVTAGIITSAGTITITTTAAQEPSSGTTTITTSQIQINQ